MCDDAPGGPNDDPYIRRSLSSQQQTRQLFSESDAVPMSTSPLLRSFCGSWGSLASLGTVERH